MKNDKISLNTYLNNLRDSLNDSSIEYDDEVFDNLEGFINELIDDNARNDKKLNSLRRINNQLNNYRDELSKRMDIIEKKAYKMEGLYNATLSKNRQLNRNYHIQKALNDQMDKYYVDISRTHQSDNEKLYELTLKKQYLMQVLANLDIIKNIIDTNITYGNLFNLDSDIRLSPGYDVISQSKLFDANYYTDRYMDDDKLDAISHYLLVGATLGYNPSENFNTNWYKQRYLLDNDANPLVSYLLKGQYEGKLPLPPHEEFGLDITNTREYTLIDESGLFDRKYYRDKYHVMTDTITHYLSIGYLNGYNPNAEFDSKYYSDKYELTDEIPLIHYILKLEDDRTNSNNLYDKNILPDIQDSYPYNHIKQYDLLDYEKYNKHQDKGFYDDEILNYVEVGYKNNYYLNDEFDSNSYQSTHDLFDNPLDNYIYDVAYNEYKYSKKDYDQPEKAVISDTREYNIIREEKLFDDEYYRRQYNITGDVDLLEHYLTTGDALGYNPSEIFDTVQYKKNHALTNTNALYHYILNFKEDILVDEQLTDDIGESIEYRLIEESGLFDANYYTDMYADELDEFTDLIMHFMENSHKNNPNKNFNSIEYMARHGYPNDSHINPLVEYILNGDDSIHAENLEDNYPSIDEKYLEDYAILSNSKYFDPIYYIEHNPNLSDNDDAIDYYIRKGRYEDYPTSKYFDKKEYYRLNLDLKTYGVDPVIHFTQNGHKEKRPFKRAKLELSDMAAYDSKICDWYDIIYESDYFDEYYYMEENPEVEALDIDPILHYILIGADNGKNPSKYFSTNEYLRVYGDVKNSHINPLYHYLNNGIHEGRFCHIPKEDYVKNYDSKYDILESKKIIKALHRKVSIIIPIYNAYEETKECIRSVLENTQVDYELILINDASSDERIETLLDSLEDISFIRVIHNKSNQGFVKNVNMGMKQSSNDVVLLNSDTKVTPKWLSRLVTSAYSDDRIATVTPISNSSDLSIEKLGLDDNQEVLNDYSYQVNKLANTDKLVSPTGNGFCLYIKREVLEDIGYFDEIFGMGYGEETDFTSRAAANGWINIRNPSVFVYHKRHASFKKQNTDKLKSKNKEIILERYPQVFDKWDSFASSLEVQKTLDDITENVKRGINSQRILCITELIDDEADIDNLMLLRLSRKYDTIVLAVGDNVIRLFKYTPQMSPIFNQWEYDFSYDSDRFFRLYFNILVNLKIDLVYLKNARRLYHSSNSEVLIYNRMIKYLEIEQITESTHTIDTILPACDKLLNPVDSFDNLISKNSSNIDFTGKRMVVYTAVTGTYDEPLIPQERIDGFDYICFTDNPFLKSDFWDIRPIDSEGLNATQTARMYKILAHKYLSDYDYSLWIDTNIEIIGDIRDFINKYSVNNKLLAFKHPQRDCIYDEADECIRLKKDEMDNIIPQINRYRDEGYPEHNGLISSGILFRKHNDPDVICVMEDWFGQIIEGSYRDQLSFNYVCYKNNFTYDATDSYIFKNEYFQIHDHLNKGYFMRKVNTQYDSWYHLKYDNEEVNTICEAFHRKTSVVIPIYNAYEETKSCIESVLENTTIDYELLLINDSSTDERIYELLESYRDYSNITVIHNDVNQGFVKNVNKAFMNTSNDVVLLNSDTIVTPKWLQKLKYKAYTNHKIATVTAVSNNAGAFSVPQPEANDIPDQFTINDMANIVEKASDDSIVQTPTANGFCMYIKKEAINDVGFFDEIYGMGYGEENDFCMRLLRKGWKHVIDPSVYIYHKRSVSFSTKKDKLIEKHSQILRMKYPDYKKRVNEFISSTNFKKIRSNIDDAINSTTKESNRKRILYAIHNGSGGALHTTMDIMKNVDKSMDTYLIVTGKQDIALYKYNSLGNNDIEHKDGDKEFVKYLQLLRKWPKEYSYTAMDTTIDELKKIYFNILVNLKIDIVHVMHLIHSSFDLVELSKLLGLPVVMSFHDFYYICPSHNLLDDNGEYCAGTCSEYNPDSLNNGQCSVAAGLNLPILKLYKQKWHKKVSEMLNLCDVFQAPSQCVCDMYKKAYPQLMDKDFRFIEHGRDLQTPSEIEVTPLKDDEPVRILFPGHIGRSKGYELIKGIKQLDVDDRLEFHYMGSIYGSEDLEDYGTYHGFYDRSDFEEIVREVNPHFIGILSIWPETYCHTLTESWSCGVPVLTIDIGALGERVHEHGGGFFIDMDAERAYRDILDIIADEDAYAERVNEITGINIKTTQEMTDEYMDIYEKLIK
ncbi:MAG: glycosyltransferase [Methanosphaera sp.]|nr:glycosyltransferase [Methanosphaera sp.]